MKYISVLIILFLFSFNALGCNTKNESPESKLRDSSLTPGDKKASNFTLKSTDGKEIKLSDYKGKIVILDFWATWCGPCRRGVPELISIQKEFKDDVVIIGISLDAESTKDDIKPFMKEMGINYPIVYGDDKVVTDFGGIEAIPTSFVIDRQGNIVDQHVGLVSKDVFTNKIKELKK